MAPPRTAPSPKYKHQLQPPKTYNKAYFPMLDNTHVLRPKSRETHENEPSALKRAHSGFGMVGYTHARTHAPQADSLLAPNPLAAALADSVFPTLGAYQEGTLTLIITHCGGRRSKQGTGPCERHYPRVASLAGPPPPPTCVPPSGRVITGATLPTGVPGGD